MILALTEYVSVYTYLEQTQQPRLFPFFVPFPSLFFFYNFICEMYS